MRRFFIVGTILLFSFLTSLAQDFRYDHITANENLGDNFVRRVFEDSYGYIWIATKDGLSCYDGYDVKTYKNIENDSKSLSSSYVADIKEDDNGDLWIGTGNGLSKYNRKYDHFKQYLFEGAQNNSIYDIEIVSNTLWLATQDGLCKFSIDTEQYEWYFSTHFKEKLHGNHIRIARIVKGTGADIWLGFAAENGLVRFNTETLEYTQYIHKVGNEQSIPTNAISAITMFNDSTLLVGCIDGGVSVLDINTSIFSAIEVPQSLTKSGMGMPWCIFLDSKKNVWVGSINGGLFLYDSLLHFKKNYIPYESNTDGINSLSISSIVEDQKGNLWFGTHSGGVNILYRRKNLFKQYKKTTHRKSISHNLVSSFYETEPNILWIGSDGGGLNVFNTQTDDFSYYTTETGLSSNAILSILPYQENELAIATWDGGVILFNTKTRKSTSLQHEKNNPNSLNFKYIKHVFRRGDSLIISTHSLGINIYDIKKKKFYHSTSNSGLEYLSVPETGNKALYDINNNLWCATTRGLYRIYKDTVFEYLPDTGSTRAVLDKYITDLYIDIDNRLWIGTLKGLNLYNYKTNDFTNFKDNEMLNHAIMSIVEDSYGVMWLGTNAGLVRYNHMTGDASLFNKLDGLQGNQFFERAAYKDSQGRLFFGGMNGFNMFHPNDIIKDTTTPSIYFTDFRIFYQSQKPNGENSVLKKHINFTKEIILDYSQNIISIDYIGLHFLVPQKNEYSYILEGFDKHWYNVGLTRSATYTNLAPGTYTFRVRSCNADKVWSQYSKDLIIHILPPWWMTWWFRTTTVILLLAIIFLIFYMRTRNIKQQNKLLERKVNQRTLELQLVNAELESNKEELQSNNEKLQLVNKELEMNKEELQTNNEVLQETLKTKDRFFNIIAHDLKSPMNSLLGFSDLLLQRWDGFSDDKKHKFIGMIHSSSQNLFSLLTNLLEWSRSQTGKISVNLQPVDLNSIVAETLVLLRSQAANKLVEITSYINDDVTVIADLNMLNTVVRNIIANAIKYTPKNGTISISHENNNKVTKIYIKDTGVGMNEQQIKSMFKVDVNASTPGTENEKGTGLGLLVCYEFVKKMEGTIQVESTEGEGTTFILELPNI